MGKVALTDGSGAWFDADTAVKFSEATYWDGHNRVSRECGKWEHEALYWTAKGGWVLDHWSQMEGTPEMYVSMSQDAAIAWLSRNGCWDSDQFERLPEGVRDAVQAGIESLEV